MLLGIQKLALLTIREGYVSDSIIFGVDINVGRVHLIGR